MDVTSNSTKTIYSITNNTTADTQTTARNATTTTTIPETANTTANNTNTTTVNGPHNKLPTPHHQIRPRMWAICGLLGDRDFCLLEVRRLARKKRDYVQAANLAIDLKLVDEMEELIVPLLLEEHSNMLEAFMAKSKGIQIKVMACLFYCVY